jgi:hypothetical protein
VVSGGPFGAGGPEVGICTLEGAANDGCPAFAAGGCGVEDAGALSGGGCFFREDGLGDPFAVVSD